MKAILMNLCMSNIEIIPAILSEKYEEIERQLSEVNSLVKWVQIDVVDGVYASSKTWPYINDEKELFSKIIRQEESFPFVEDVNIEVDLMVSDPICDADRWIAVGARRLVIHMKSIGIEKIKSLAKNIKDKGVGLVLGYSIDDNIETLESYISEIQSINPDKVMIDGIQCMGIDKEGYQHQSFDERVLKNITAIKELFPYVHIAVDGGVNRDTIKKLIEAGATRLVIGSTIFSGNPKENITEVQKIVG